MSIILIDEEWTRKPTCPVELNKSHWAAKYAIRLVYFTTDGLAHDLVTGKVFKPDSGAIFSVDQHGRYLDCAAAEAGVSFGNNSVKNADLTVVASVKWKNSTVYGAIVNQAIQGGFVDPYYSFLLRKFLSPQVASFYTADGVGNAAEAYSTSTFADGQKVFLVGVNQGHLVADGKKIYVNGRLEGTGQSVQAQASTQPVRVGNLTTSSGYAWDGGVYWIGIFDGIAFTEEQQRELYNNQFDLIQPRSIPIPYTASSGVSVTPGVGEITWDGGTPSSYKIKNQAPQAGEYAWYGVAPTATAISGATVVNPLTGQIEWSGVAPTTYTIKYQTPALGEIVWQGVAPSVTTGKQAYITPLAGQIEWAGNAPSLFTIINQTPQSGQIEWAGGTPSISTPQSCEWSIKARATGAWTAESRVSGSWTRKTRVCE